MKAFHPSIYTQRGSLLTLRILTFLLFGIGVTFYGVVRPMLVVEKAKETLQFVDQQLHRKEQESVLITEDQIKAELLRQLQFQNIEINDDSFYFEPPIDGYIVMKFNFQYTTKVTSKISLLYKDQLKYRFKQ